MSETETAWPAPRECSALTGHQAQIAAFAAALSSQRLHHAWLLAGPRGVGKASFAHLASHALITRQSNLGVAEDDACHHRIAEGNEPQLVSVHREVNEKTGKLRTQISIEQVRGLRASLELASEASEWRCVIVDAAEEMSVGATNALLKLLEEPPPRVVFFLVTHAPGRLLPTIRSRCRRLEFHGLANEAVTALCRDLAGAEPPDTLVAAAQGSIGVALDMMSGAGVAVASAVEAVVAPLPGGIDRAALHRLADLVAKDADRRGFLTAARLAGDLAARTARFAAGSGEERPRPEALANRLRQGAQTAALWAEAASAIDEQTQRAIGLNLDQRQAFLDMFARLEAAARRSCA